METKPIKCTNCCSKLDLGKDAIKVDEGVIGLKGFITLEKVSYFCCEKCLTEYFDTTGLPNIPGRFP